MFGFLNKYLFYEYVKNFFFVVAMFFPIIYFSDFLLSDVFNPWASLMKVPFRYGQMLGILSFLGSYISVKKILYTHGKWIFTSLKCKKIDFIFSFIHLSCMISAIFYLLIIPLNDKVFDYKEYVSKWAIVASDKNIKYIHDDDQSIGYDVWEIEKDSILKNYRKRDLDLSKVDFYIVWNETKKMSFKRLEEYKKYMDKNRFSSEDYYKQKQIYYSRFLVVLIMLLCGYVIALTDSFWFFVFCFLFFNWLDLLAFFLPLKYCILFLWCNICFWFLICFLGLLL